MDIEALKKPLSINEIDFRIQSINKGGYATILAYKDARVDMHRLNDVFGVGYWQRKHEMIGDRLYCSIGIFNKDIGQWAWVQDVGTESNTEKEKGQASDSFKRACFNLGIGIELYDYPVIQVKLRGDGTNQKDEWFLHDGKYPKPGWGLKLKSWVWYSVFDANNQLSYLAAKDEQSLRYEWGTRPQKQKAA